ncbi:hypothetical protein ANCCEY_08057 [Ancylostoma ceylanicum]|uniref:Uncharacterized protein n=1 Tax=Ancylostoma ceylanicum TaxID=53326 RepID=A0A0D6LNS1_9BILA|nr:hypothetical protein ANCCEY_08057 [Ancylostoma ceylanicum]
MIVYNSGDAGGKDDMFYVKAAPNYHMMSCIIQKSMSTVMSAIFCYLSREKEFISAGRNILREMSDIG